MDYQEAIEIIEYASAFNSENSRLTKALNIDISAMRELQALHEQGFSLERIKDIDFRKDVVEHINYYAYMELQEELEKYRDIGTLEEVRDAAEKQRAKRAKIKMMCRDIEYWCPNCRESHIVMHSKKGLDYCHHCGQKLDWSNKDDR